MDEGSQAMITEESEVVIGIIGYGYWGPNLARNFLNLDGVRLKYICDASPKRREEARRACNGVQIVSDPSMPLDDPEVVAVAIASPAATHYEMTLRAFESGKHVFVEKPMSLNVSEGEELVRLALEKGLILVVGHLFIYHPAVQYMKHCIESESLGKLFYAYSQRLNLGRLRRDENCLWSLAPHDVSIMLYLFGEEPESVVCRGTSYLRGGIEDVVFFTMYFPGGQTGNVHVSWLDPRKVRLFTVVGSEKMLVFDDMSPDAKIKVYDRKVYPVGPEEIMGYGEELRIHFGGEDVPELQMEEPLKIECSSFIDSIRSGTALRTGGRQGLAVLRVLDAASRSMKDEGRPVSIAPEGE